MPAQGLYWCQPSATMSFFGNISGSTKLLQLSCLEPLEVIRWSAIWHGFTLKCWIASIWWRQKSSVQLPYWRRSRDWNENLRTRSWGTEGWQGWSANGWPKVRTLLWGYLWCLYETTQPLAISLNYNMMLRASCLRPHEPCARRVSCRQLLFIFN